MTGQVASGPALAVWPAQVFFVADAEKIAQRLQCPLLPVDAGKQVSDPYSFLLRVDASGLALLQGKSVIQVDFVAGANLHRRLHGGGRGQPIAKAIGLKAGNIVPRVLDCTAGLGRDAFVLASLGCNVRMCERSPLVQLLLQDGITRAQASNDPAANDIAARLLLHAEDAQTALSKVERAGMPDVIYLDPMFPERRKKSAAVKKEMAAFHTLVGVDEDADQLLPLALEKAAYRVVVKRPRHAPYLGNCKPGLVLEGESTRFDIYPLRSMEILR
ncbi:MAG TPA: class I SAM-dependent methyltransferase [Pseudomonadales bacterium]|nr:class I SAM-dependent methyltransferase [Pseudomonadales bacterium]